MISKRWRSRNEDRAPKRLERKDKPAVQSAPSLDQAMTALVRQPCVDVLRQIEQAPVHVGILIIQHFILRVIHNVVQDSRRGTVGSGPEHEGLLRVSPQRCARLRWRSWVSERFLEAKLGAVEVGLRAWCVGMMGVYPGRLRTDALPHRPEVDDLRRFRWPYECHEPCHSSLGGAKVS